MKRIEFTPQELKVIKLICRQLTSKEIGEKMGLSFRTIEGYRESIQKKIKARNAVGIALFAARNELIKL